MNDRLDLHALADGELSSEHQIQVLAWINADRQARAEFEQIISLKKCLATRLPSVDCRDAWKVSQARLVDIRKTRRVEGTVRKYSWAMCAGLFAMIAIGGIANRTVSAKGLDTSDLAQMASTLGPGTKAAAGANTAETNAYLDRLLGQARIALDSKFRFVGQAFGEIRGCPFQCLQLRDDKGPLSLVAIQGTLEVGESPIREIGRIHAKATMIQGMNALVWKSANGESMVLVGNRTYEELEHAVGRLYGQ